ncbi:glycosyltransferase family 39 protein [Stappia stellulata]|uniref:glycosyltransferase family 39 protein n=1 Tax=Stappia stellulata TaxID=71235 RepID=UPI0004070371|nr:glycosyltransferase family 39 protein [Stappia stellulata]
MPHVSRDAGTDVPVWLRPATLALVVLALTLVKLVVAANSGLAEDEAYYRLWGLNPSAGYYDHPPMVGWWVAAGLWIAGDNALGIRLLPVLSALAGSAALWRTGYLLFGARAAGWAVLFFNASLLIGIGSLLATPDAPSVFFWGLTVWALAELHAGRNPNWWLAVGLFAGLGLASKYSVLFLGAGIVLWLVLVPDARRWWSSWQLWAGGVLALAIVAPVVLWNADHQWASFVKQFGRAVPDGWSTKYIFEFLGAVIGLLNPLVAVLAGVGLARAVSGARRGDAGFGLMIWTCVPFFFYLLLHSLHSRVQGNWPAPLFPALALLAGVVVADPPAAFRRGIGLLAKGAVVLGIAVSLVVYVHAVQPLTGSLARKDPTFQTRGWGEIREEVKTLAEDEGAAWIATYGYGLNAQLAFNLSGILPVEQLTERIRYVMQPSLGAETLERPALFIVEARRDPGAEALGERFGEATRVAVLTRRVKGVALEELVVYRVAAARGDPRDPVYPLP